MGTYTTIIHPVDSRNLQITCGQDTCCCYKVGDNVNSYIIEDWAGEGYLLDDVYESYSYKEDDWVIIKDGKVLCVEPRDIENENQYEELKAKYEIKEYPKECWTKEAWVQQEKIEKECEEKFKAFQKSISNLPLQQRMGAMFSYPISQIRDDNSLLRKAITVEKL